MENIELRWVIFTNGIPPQSVLREYMNINAVGAAAARRALQNNSVPILQKYENDRWIDVPTVVMERTVKEFR